MNDYLDDMPAWAWLVLCAILPGLGFFSLGFAYAKWFYDQCSGLS